MLDKLVAVLLRGPSDQWTPIMGRLPDAPALTALAAMAQPRSAARKQAQGLAISVPIPGDRWVYWLLSEVPAASELAALMSRLQELSAGIDRVSGAAGPVPDPKPRAAGPGDDRGSELLRRVRAGLNRADHPKRSALAAAILDQLVETGAIEGGALVEWTDEKLRKSWLSDSRFKSHSRELGLLAAKLRGPAPVATVLTSASDGEQAVEATMLARQFNSESLAFTIPRQGDSGVGLVAFGAREADLGTLQAASDLFGLMRPVAPARTARRRWIRRIAGLAAIAGLAVWLSLPAPLAITATADAQAADVTVVALPTDGYLAQVLVRSGDAVTAGMTIARFTSPQLEDALAEERLNASVEQLNAQVALAENRYSDYQIAVQRAEISATRIAQTSERIEGLAVVSPIAGRVLNAMPETATGAYARTGQEVAAIQTSDRILVRMALERLDARLVKPGMQGTVFFRGLANRAYDVTVLTPAAVVTDPQTGQERVEATAELAASEDVIAGMSGIVSLDGAPAPRVVSYGRYAYEFLRERLWTYLGLKF